jgi:lysophospholipase L1-like esterase
MNRIILFLCLLLVSFKPATYRRILFVGDSLTCYQGGWQSTVAKGLDMKFDNISKGGKRTKWMLSTLQSYLERNEFHSTLIIYGGINDSFAMTNENETINNIQSMVNLGQQYEMEVIVIVGYNPEKVNVRTTYDEATTTRCRNRYIKLQKKIQERIVGCRIVSMDNTVDRSDSDDGIHLKASGHRKFAKHVLNELLN